MITATVIRKTKGLGLLGIISGLRESAEQGVKAALEDTQSTAVSNLTQMEIHPLDVSPSQVKTELELVADIAEGRVWVDSDRSLFVEFGTGTFAEMPHVGKTKTFLSSGYSVWLLPEEKADRDYGSDRLIKTGNYSYYLMYPQQPHPFMRNAAFENRDKSIEELWLAIKRLTIRSQAQK